MKGDYRVILSVDKKLKQVTTTKRGGGAKVREAASGYFKEGDLCRIKDNVAYPLEDTSGAAPEVLVIVG